MKKPPALILPSSQLFPVSGFAVLAMLTATTKTGQPGTSEILHSNADRVVFLQEMFKTSPRKLARYIEKAYDLRSRCIKKQEVHGPWRSA